MNGLRLYKNVEVPEMQGGYPVFYSRCHDGPYYRWAYDDNSRKWQACRLPPSVLAQRILASTALKMIPAPLKTNIVEHYQLD